MKSCSFTGHRPEKLFVKNFENEIKCKLKNEIRKNIITLINNGVSVFYSGMARGTDIWSAEIVIELKKEFKNISLICVLPFKNQINDKWNEEEKIIYNNIIKNCSKVKIIYDYYKKDAFEKRNKYLVDNADVIIAVYNPKYIRSGTGQTVRMAQRVGIEVIIINPEEYIKH